MVYGDVVFRTARSQGARKRMGYDERYVFEEDCSKKYCSKATESMGSGLEETGNNRSTNCITGRGVRRDMSKAVGVDG